MSLVRCTWEVGAATGDPGKQSHNLLGMPVV